MKFDWKRIARIAATVASDAVPQAVAIERAVEGIAGAGSKAQKADQALEAGLASLEAAAELSGKNFATPRVKNAIRGINDAGVELLNALAEAHAITEPAAPPTAA